MLWSIMSIVLWVSLGLMIGVILMSLVANSGYQHKCDDCIYTELIEMFELWGEDDE